MKTRLHIFIIFCAVILTSGFAHAMEEPCAIKQKYSLSHLIRLRQGIKDQLLFMDMITFVKQVSIGSYCQLVVFSRGIGELFDVNNNYSSTRRLASSVASPPSFENVMLLEEEKRLLLVGWEASKEWVTEQYEYVFDVTDENENGPSILPYKRNLGKDRPTSSEQMATNEQLWEKGYLSDGIFDIQSLTAEEKKSICGEFSDTLKTIHCWDKIGDKIICGHYGIISIWNRKKTSI